MVIYAVAVYRLSMLALAIRQQLVKLIQITVCVDFMSKRYKMIQMEIDWTVNLHLPYLLILVC